MDPELQITPEDRAFFAPYAIKIEFWRKGSEHLPIYYLREKDHRPGLTFQATATSLDGLRWQRRRLAPYPTR